MSKVLIVDDDAQLLTILTESLKKYQNKFEIITAKDGLEAIKSLQKQQFSLVVTDIQMPIVNGLVLLAYMAKSYPTIPCIVMTAHGTSFLKRRLQQETSHYIEKPFKVDELAQIIMSTLGQKEVLRGSLNGVSVVGFMKLIEMEYITCLCVISGANGEKGYLVFDGGILLNAYYGKLRKEEAAVRLFQMRDVSIKFRNPPMEKVSRQIKTKLSDLLTEAMKGKDEIESPERGRRVWIAETSTNMNELHEV